MKTHTIAIVRSLFVFLLILSLAASCAPRARVPYRPYKPAKAKPLPRMGYSIQVGAFSSEVNAARFTQSLKEDGVDAYYFVHKSGIYKVRFGNFPTDRQARERAAGLRRSGVIGEFFIVRPGDYAAARADSPHLRKEIVRTAESFIGVKYLWGGTSTEEGFDCSGLTMAVYRHNGLDLPRSSKEQFESGTPVGREDLRPGDLVFFMTSGVKKVSHVGVYVGDGKFIHAPSRGKKICTAALSQRYFADRFAGGRTYI
jgi:hypothetical protein